MKSRPDTPGDPAGKANRVRQAATAAAGMDAEAYARRDVFEPRRGTDQMTVDVQTEIVIDQPVERVAGYAADPSNAPEWYANIDAVEWKTTPPVAVGSAVAFVARFLGRRLEYTYEIVEFDPGERLVMRTRQGPFPMETTYTWSAFGDGSTRMTLRNRGEPAGFARITAGAMQRAMRRANSKDLRNLKRILEPAVSP
jgi:uncharacterized protein YndB with AHSA1/START domain